MAEFGGTVSVLVATDGELIAGHGRVLAAAHLGLTEAPVIVLGHLSEAQRRAFRIADSKLSELGGWDDALLLQELQALLTEDFDLGLIGIPQDELDALLADADDRPTFPTMRPMPSLAHPPNPSPSRATSGRWASTASAAAMPQIRPLSPGRCEAIRPRVYFAALCPAARLWRGQGEGGDWDPLMQGVFAAAPITADAQLLVNLGLVHRDSEWQPSWKGWVEWMRTFGWRRFGWYVWDQGPGLPDDWNGCLASWHEFIVRFNRALCKPQRPSRPNTQAKHSAAVGCAAPTALSTPRPEPATRSKAIVSRTASFASCDTRAGWVQRGRIRRCSRALVEAVLTAFSDPGDLIYEPFCGSGTQLVAAERAGRRCFAMELDPVYCDVAVRRWEMATGRKARQKAS